MADEVGSLYDLSIRSVVNQDKLFSVEFRSLPDVVQCDVYQQLYMSGKFETLNAEICDIEAFGKALRAGNQRVQLYSPFQALMDHGFCVSKTLADEFCQRCQNVTNKENPSSDCNRLIGLGLSVGSFLAETGWYSDAERVLVDSVALFDTRILCHCRILLKLLTRLLHVRTANCKFTPAKNTFDDAMELVQKLRMKGEGSVDCAALHGEKCSLLFALSQYDEAYGSSLRALQEVALGLPVKTVVDILRQASKACVVKRKFKKAETLIKQALFLARQHFGDHHPKYADSLIDYGFYLLNVDSIRLSVQVYKAAFHVREKVFGTNNLHVATAHEDLAYALYVQEYSTGNFEEAKTHAQASIDIITRVLPDDHLLLASSKRVKALILEEVAIDCRDLKQEQENLHKAQMLHLSSLELARKAFGENNVQTAKHYGNLGRLYQSMRKFKEAEDMHKKAIEIKERILGNEDYEVALSLGHLASLYNYDMERYDRAEELYLRSIEIGRKLFGDGYSGLEYDYRGLINLYDSIENFDSMERYHRILKNWKEIRERAPPANPVHHEAQEPWPTNQFIRQFLSQPD